MHRARPRPAGGRRTIWRRRRYQICGLARSNALERRRERRSLASFRIASGAMCLLLAIFAGYIVRNTPIVDRDPAHGRSVYIARYTIDDFARAPR